MLALLGGAGIVWGTRRRGTRDYEHALLITAAHVNFQGQNADKQIVERANFCRICNPVFALSNEIIFEGRALIETLCEPCFVHYHAMDRYWYFAKQGI